MAFWFLEERGHGRFRHFIPKQISSKKAEELDDKGIELFDTKAKAQKKANELRGN